MTIPWQPSASLETLRARADALRRIRSFFEARGVLEVETPLLASSAASDPRLWPIELSLPWTALDRRRAFLQTSPEYAMKRLLARDAVPIFQICKAFRGEEEGRHHQPEFTMLEWYRPSWDHLALMDECLDLLALFFDEDAHVYRYAELFKQHTGLDLDTASSKDFCKQLHTLGFVSAREDDSRTMLRQALFCHAIEPHFKKQGIVVVLDYPEDEAALSQVAVDASGRRYAERFEIYLSGIELANGYHELLDAQELESRMERDRITRVSEGLVAIPNDTYLLEAMRHGLPPCSGVALGFDRLMMALLEMEHIQSVLSFDFSRV